MWQGKTRKSKADTYIKEAAARLMAVQAVYQMAHVDTLPKDVIAEYLKNNVGQEVEGYILADPDGALFQKIVLGVDARRPDLQKAINHLYAKRETGSDLLPEKLLNAILLCAGYELLEHTDIDFPILINDYLNVTDAFYDRKEKSLVNGLLDAMAKTFRDT